MIEEYIAFTSDKRFVQRVRELKTIEVMVDMYCAAHHAPQQAGQARCSNCADLLAYAQRRLERCVFGDAKPNCAKCVVHCYNKDMREQVRAVMRWAGPRMLLTHPILGIRHLIADHKPIPVLPTSRDQPQTQDSP